MTAEAGSESPVGTPITVHTYSGFKADERPVSFANEGRLLRISEIVDRWYDPDGNYFRVVAEGAHYLLRHDLNADLWELVAPAKEQ